MVDYPLDVGIHAGVPETVYHSDPCTAPSASASILQTLYTASPEHAAWDHPKLNPAWAPRPGSEAQNNGTILHSLILGQPPRHRALDFDSFRTDKAKEARDTALKHGFIPILRHKLDELLPVADVLRGRLMREHPETYAALMDPETIHEATVVARLAGGANNGILTRCRFDVLPPARYGFTADFKFTGRSAEPEEWSKKLRNDYLFQGNIYPRCLHATRGDMPEFRFIVCEWEAPYGASIHALDGALSSIANRRANVALRRWDHCLGTGVWPNYPPFVHRADAPGWMITQDEAMASRDNFLAKQEVM